MSTAKRVGLFFVLVGALTGCSSRDQRSPFESPLSQPAPAQVQTGADRLVSGEFDSLIQGKKVAVLAHSASRLKDGTHFVDRLASLIGSDLKLIFAPEHGFRTEYDSPVPDYQDPKTGVMVYSLYGPRKAPTKELLDQVDVIFIDLQDVGVRFYTYAATMALTLEAARSAGKTVFILDRPNPIGGSVVSGPMLDSNLVGGITAFHSIPLLHGMTLGELLLLYNVERGYGADLKVIPMKNWSRAFLWADTKLSWHAPSPALPTFEQAMLYSWLGTLESLPLAVGRGKVNDQAFRVYGAPWISSDQALAIVNELNRFNLRGLKFSQVSWTPTRSDYEGILCQGFRVEVQDARLVNGQKTLIVVMNTLQRILGDSIQLRDSSKAFGSKAAIDLMILGVSSAEIEHQVEKGVSEFLKVREKYLLY